MKHIHLLFFLQLSFFSLSAQQEYTKYFTDDKLRYDYTITGDHQVTRIQDMNFYREHNWSGPKLNLIDTFQYGELLLEVFDSSTSKLIYSKGYSSLYKEWQTTDEAILSERTFSESVIAPFPKHSIRIKLSERGFDMRFKEIHTTYINPTSREIEEIEPFEFVRSHHILVNGPVSSKVDIVFVSEGYTSSEEEFFFDDVKKFSDILFNWDPYHNYRNAFNIYGVFVASEDKGADIPQDSLWLNTALNAGFNTFGSDRYLTTNDICRVRDVVTGIPYDQICILVNSDKYGGGGIYNFYTIFSTGNALSEFLFHHEFGHGFASLADEYFSSIVPYNNMVNLNCEPYQPNITTRINFDRKWKSMIADTVPIPTPYSQAYTDVIGLFEGAAYTSKGVYRPCYDCSMKSKINNAFCPVCKIAIEQMILFYYTSE